MNRRVAIVTDSISCLNKQVAEQNGIKIVPATITSGGKVYRDWVDVTPTEAYELFLKDPDSFGTSPAAPMDYVKAYRELGALGRDIFCITISTGISTMYDIARTAREQVSSELSAISIEIFDSQLCTAAEGFVVLEAAKAANQGKSLPEVAKVAEEIRGKANFIVLLDTIRHIYRSGRIPKIASQIGSALNIKPLLTMSSGKIHFTGAVRTHKHGLDKLFRMLRSQVGRDPAHFAVMHAYAPDKAKYIMERLSQEFNCAELWLTEFSPVMGYVCGTGTVGFAFFRD